MIKDRLSLLILLKLYLFYFIKDFILMNPCSKMLKSEWVMSSMEEDEFRLDQNTGKINKKKYFKLDIFQNLIFL